MSFFSGLFPKEKKESLDQGLQKTKESFFSKLGKAIAGKSTVDDEVLDNLEEILVSSDVGIQTTVKIIERIQARVARDKYLGTSELDKILKEEIANLLTENNSQDLSDFDVPAGVRPYVLMVVGVNGVGKTTTIGKLSAQFKRKGKSVVLGAADTFRAAAVDQLKLWGERVGVPVISKGMNTDPSAVAYDAVKHGVDTGADIVIIDTAGRLHTKVNLMAELQTQYETVKKENEILMLKQENEIKDSRLNQSLLAIFLLIAILSAILGLGYLWNNRLKLKQQAELQSTRAFLREGQLKAVIASQEEERKRFAADLHDGFGQMISALRLSLSRETLDKSTIDHALEVLNEMNTEIRNIAFNLMPQVLMKSGLEEALKEFTARINRTGSVTVSVQTYDLDRAMSADQRIALYRICQEWVNNVIKYSGGSQISIQLVQHPQELVLTIEDNGDGFDISTLTESQGNGWKNINSRLHMIKGSIEIDTHPGRKGTTVVVNVPYAMALAA